MPNRPRRSAAEWAELIAQYNAGHESDAVFCERHDVSFATFRKWKYRYAPHRSASARSPTPDRTGFIELTAVKSPSRSSIRIELGGGLSIECPLEMEPTAIAQLIKAIGDER
jgi:hypothetical protein